MVFPQEQQQCSYIFLLTGTAVVHGNVRRSPPTTGRVVHGLVSFSWALSGRGEAGCMPGRIQDSPLDPTAFLQDPVGTVITSLRRLSDAPAFTHS